MPRLLDITESSLLVLWVRSPEQSASDLAKVTRQNLNHQASGSKLDPVMFKVVPSKEKK